MMFATDLFPERVPFVRVPYIYNRLVEAYKNAGEKLPAEILQSDIVLNDSQRRLELGRDEDGYFLKVTEVYRLVK